MSEVTAPGIKKTQNNSSSDSIGERKEEEGVPSEAANIRAINGLT